MTRPILTIACRAGDLESTLAESIRRLEHQREQRRRAYLAKLDDALGYRWVLTAAGERALRGRGVER